MPTPAMTALASLSRALSPDETIALTS